MTACQYRHSCALCAMEPMQQDMEEWSGCLPIWSMYASDLLLKMAELSGMQCCLVMSAARQQSSGAGLGPTYKESSAMRPRALDAGRSLFARLQRAVALDVVRG